MSKLPEHDKMHHLNNTYEIISTLLKSIQKLFPQSDYNLEAFFDFEEVISSFKLYFSNEWLEYFLCNTNKPMNFHEYNLNRYGINSKLMYNPEELEKIACDYHNTIVCISNFFNQGSGENHSNLKYVEPLKNYELECSISMAIQFNIVNDVYKIKAYDNLGKDISLKENLDYYKFDYNSFQTFIFPFEVLRKYEMPTIELQFSYEKSKKIKTSDYLSVRKEDCLLEELYKRTSKLSCDLGASPKKTV